MRPYPAVSTQQLGCFTTYQALRSGWTRSALARAVRSGRLIRVRHGVLATPEDGLTRWDQARRDHARAAVAATLTTPGIRVAAAAAAIVHDVPVLFVPDLSCVSGERWLTGSAPGVHLHRTPEGRIVWLGSARCDPLARAVLDVAREHGVAAGLVPLDAALHGGRVTRAAVARELSVMAHWPGVRAARETLDLADPRCESPLESRSRLVLIRCDLPPPATQVRIGTATGRFVGRVDFYWDGFGVVGEADGDGKYSVDADAQTLLDEKRRQEQLEDLGLRVVRWSSADLRDPERLEHRLRTAFGRGVLPGSAGRAWTVLPDHRTWPSHRPLSAGESGR